MRFSGAGLVMVNTQGAPSARGLLKNLKVSHCEGAKRLKQSVSYWQQTDRLLHPAIAGFAMTGMRLFQQARLRWDCLIPFR